MVILGTYYILKLYPIRFFFFFDGLDSRYERGKKGQR